MSNFLDVLDVFESDWLQAESEGLFTALGILVKETEKGPGFTYTVKFDKKLQKSERVTAGWSSACEGVLTVTEDDPDWSAMANIIRKGDLTDEDKAGLQFLYMKKFFSQFAAFTLDHPVSSNRLLVFLSRIDTTFHAALKDDKGKIHVAHTASFAGGKWTVTDGLNGDISRIFIMNIESTREYILALRKAQNAGFFYGFIAWSIFFWWYRSWTKKNSWVLGGSSSTDTVGLFIP